MIAKLRYALIAVGITGAFVIGSFAAAGLIHRFGSGSSRLFNRGDAYSEADAAADAVLVSEEPCHES